MNALSITSILFIMLFLGSPLTVTASGDPAVGIQGENANSIYDLTVFTGLKPCNAEYDNQYKYKAYINNPSDGNVPQNASKEYKWIVVGGIIVGKDNEAIVSIRWDNKPKYVNNNLAHSLRLTVKFKWENNGAKTINSKRANGSDEAEPIDVKYISEPASITFNNSTFNNNGSLIFPCGAIQKTVSIPAVTTDPAAAVTYYFYYPAGWTGPVSSLTPTVTVTSHANSSGTIKVEARRNDCDNFRTRIAITLTRPLPTKPVINSPDFLLCSPKTITSSASNATSYNWIGAGGITASSPGKTSSAQITGVSDGTVKVSATSSVCAYTSAYSIPINVKRSAPEPAALTITGNNGGYPDFMCAGYGVQLSAYTAEPGTVFSDWSTSNPGNSYLSFFDGSAYFNSYIDDCYGIDVTVSNCFGAVKKGITICVDHCAKETPVYSLFPNPAKDQIVISFEDAEAPLPVAVRMFSEASQKEAKSIDIETLSLIPGEPIKIDVAAMPRGIYYVHLIYIDKPSETSRIVLE